MNLLNFFNTFTGCATAWQRPARPIDCRGANNQRRVRPAVAKTVAARHRHGADVIGINEIENDGYGPTSAIQFLVDKLNAATAPGTYAFIDVGRRDRPGRRGSATTRSRSACSTSPLS